MPTGEGLGRYIVGSRGVVGGAGSRREKEGADRGLAGGGGRGTAEGVAGKRVGPGGDEVRATGVGLGQARAAVRMAAAGPLGAPAWVAAKWTRVTAVSEPTSAAAR